MIAALQQRLGALAAEYHELRTYALSNLVPADHNSGDELPSFKHSDAYLNAVRAEGIEILTGKLQQLIDEGVFDAKEIGVAAGAVHEGAQIAAQLRAGAPKGDSE